MEQQQVQENYYLLLGVPRDATTGEIHDAYQSRIPSLIGPERHALEQAYRTLSRPEERKVYDESLPKGIFYFEATQAFDWNDTHSQESKETTEIAYHAVNEVAQEEVQTIAIDGYIDLSKQLAAFAPDDIGETQGTLSHQALHPNFSTMGGFGATAHRSKEDLDYLSQYHGRQSRSQHAPHLQSVRGLKSDYALMYQGASIHDMIVRRNQMTNRLLLAIGLGTPMITLLGCIAYLLSQ
ncbi:MAG: hypothetical protein KDD55_11415 [Bdellovibrionales bacterium]|nr:hypothetical protein [Bdellovibrionales bacterium]